MLKIKNKYDKIQDIVTDYIAIIKAFEYIS